jgi:hypothetical protein
VPRISKTLFKNFLLYNFEPVRLNDAVFIRSSICLWSLLMTSSYFLAFSGWKVRCWVAQTAGNGWSFSFVLQRVLDDGTFSGRLDAQTYYRRHQFADLLIWHTVLIIEQCLRHNYSPYRASFCFLLLGHDNHRFQITLNGV